MSGNSHTAEQWVDATIQEHARGALIGGFGYLLVALVAVVLWFGVTFGLMFIGSFGLTAIGIGPNEYKYVVIGVYVLQCGLYLFVRRKSSTRWEVSADVDGSVCVVPPEHSRSEDDGLLHRGILKSLFFAIPIALEEAFVEFARAMHIRRVDRRALARLTAALLETQRKAAFTDLEQRISCDVLKAAVEGAAVLPGFQLFANEPQGVTLTSFAIEELATTR